MVFMPVNHFQYDSWVLFCYYFSSWSKSCWCSWSCYSLIIIDNIILFHLNCYSFQANQSLLGMYCTVSFTKLCGFEFTRCTSCRATCFLGDGVVDCVLDIVDGAYDLFMLRSYTHGENQEKLLVCSEPHLCCCIFCLCFFSHLKSSF